MFWIQTDFKTNLKSNVQNCFTERPSILDKSPPNIHWRPGIVSIKGLHFVNTNRDSKSCKESKGRPSPSGSISPPPTVISRYAACSSDITFVKFLFSSLSVEQLAAIIWMSFKISRKCCNGRWIKDVMSGLFFGIKGSVMNNVKSLLHALDLLT